IMAFASQRATEIRAEGEKHAAKYLSDMGEHEELAIFLAWLDAVETALSTNTTLVLESDVAPWHLLDIDQISDNAIPTPKGSQ
ncbi:MAG: hypothetical protein HOK75_02835, partial [Phycisphaerae bacterium]|nr:hypothetical protein [Phycisphaerae bacterium]